MADLSRVRLRRDRELAVVLAAALLVPVFALVYTAARAGSPAEPAPALVAATATAVPATPTPPPPEPTPPPPFIPAHAERGVAFAEPAPPPVAAVPGVPVVVDTSSFAPPPARTAVPPPTSSGIARMVAPGLKINHYVETVGIENNKMQTPKDAMYAIGWYEDYARPGSGGNVVVSAHETWNHRQGPFYGLHAAAPGDEIVIEMTDGRRYRYAVFSNVRYSVDDIPMAEIIWPSARPRGEEWLTLITCGGRIVYDARGFGDYLDRDVVIAKRVG